MQHFRTRTDGVLLQSDKRSEHLLGVPDEDNRVEALPRRLVGEEAAP